MKQNFIRQMQIDAAAIACLINTIRDRKQTYIDREYGPAGADSITGDDVLEATGNDTLAVADFAPDGDGLAMLMLQLLNLSDGDIVVSGDYGETLNRVRNDV